jgi:hypothetical protein
MMGIKKTAIISPSTTPGLRLEKADMIQAAEDLLPGPMVRWRPSLTEDTTKMEEMQSTNRLYLKRARPILPAPRKPSLEMVKRIASTNITEYLPTGPQGANLNLLLVLRLVTRSPRTFHALQSKTPVGTPKSLLLTIPPGRTKKIPITVDLYETRQGPHPYL